MPLQKTASGALLKTAGGALTKECCCDAGCETCEADPGDACPLCECTPDSWHLEIIDPIELDEDCCAITGLGSHEAQAAALDDEWCIPVNGSCVWEYDGAGEGVFDVYPSSSDCTGELQAQADLVISIQRVSTGIRVLIVSDSYIIFDGTITDGFTPDVAGGCDETHDVDNGITDFVCDAGDAGARRAGKNGTVRITPCCTP